MDNKEIREKLAKLVGRMHNFAIAEMVAISQDSLNPDFLRGKATAYDRAAQMVVEIIREIDRDNDRSLMDQAQQYEKSEKDALWESD